MKGIIGTLEECILHTVVKRRKTMRATFRLHNKADLEARKVCRGLGGYPHMYIPTHAKITKIGC